MFWKDQCYRVSDGRYWVEFDKFENFLHADEVPCERLFDRERIEKVQNLLKGLKEMLTLILLNNVR